MSDQGILFSAPMVRALLAGTKTQTRRIAKVRKGLTLDEMIQSGERMADGYQATREMLAPPRFAVGDRLWVKETWAKVGDAEDDIHACPDLRIHAYYRADAVCPEQQRWRPSIFMPRWASRITLIVTDVRVERLQSISDADAMAEGIEQFRADPRLWRNYSFASNLRGTSSAITSYRSLWDSINGPGAWEANPWVVAISFTVRRGNIDE